MTDQQKLLAALIKHGADIARVSANALPASDKRGYAKDLQALANKVNETIVLLTIE